jgi:Fur family ferric uptake transcriptional regulator
MIAQDPDWVTPFNLQPGDRMSDITDLKKAGLKATLPRLKILSILEAAQVRHMTAEDVYKSLLEAGEEVGLATVYRVLTQFETAGLVIRHNFEGGRSVFEMNQGHHHDHMVCVECGKVFEFYDSAIEERQRLVAGKAGFVMDEHSLYIYGICQGMKKNGVCSKK